MGKKSKKYISNDHSELIQQDSEVKYRYACPACSNIAFKSVDKSTFGSKVCGSCGAEIKVLKAENYIAL